jgi:hypothetical protein
VTCTHAEAILDEIALDAARTGPISAEAATAQIEAALRLHRPPGRDIFIVIAAIALAAAVSIAHGLKE